LKNFTGKPYAGKLHVRIDEREWYVKTYHSLLYYFGAYYEFTVSYN